MLLESPCILNLLLTGGWVQLLDLMIVIVHPLLGQLAMESKPWYPVSSMFLPTHPKAQIRYGMLQYCYILLKKVHPDLDIYIL